MGSYLLTGKIHVIAAFAAITFFVSCRNDVPPHPFDMEKIPFQTVDDMVVVRSESGNVSMRMTSPLMQSFRYDREGKTISYEYYPQGIYVRAYTENGALETSVSAKEAKHVTTPGEEQWMAFGDVVVINHLKEERMTSDTMYWDKDEKKLHTDCYVKITSPSGMMQGYGMVSDERARNSEILKPFDSYSIMQDSSYVFVDTLNFVGPRR